MPTTDQIHIRDPFIVPHAAERAYYMFGTTALRINSLSTDPQFDCYRSTDLQNWTGPIPAFRPPVGFWATHDFWAPEVHHYRNRWYMFASFKADHACRATQILVADHPQGPYQPHTTGPVTPADWECLDGTLFIDDHHHPWMIFCHEWLQVHDGEMSAIPLSDDLTHALGPPHLLFHASDAPWSSPLQPDGPDFVTDGPFLHRTPSGQLLMLWSTHGPHGYAIGCARSPSGQILGPWTQDPAPLFSRDGGHGMLFRTFDNQLQLAIHRPNNSPDERPLFINVKQEADALRLLL